MAKNNQVQEGITDDGISFGKDIEKTAVEELNLAGDDSDEEIIELVDLIEKGPGIEEDLAVTLEDLPEKAAVEVEGDMQLFSDNELALGDEGSQAAAWETAEVAQLFEEEKREVVEMAVQDEISDADLTSILEEDVSATVVLDSEPGQVTEEEIPETVPDLGTDEAVEKILEPVIEEGAAEAYREPDFLMASDKSVESPVDFALDEGPERVAEPTPELDLGASEEAVIDLSYEPEPEKDIAEAAVEVTEPKAAEIVVEPPEPPPMEGIEETLDLTKESLTEQPAKPGGDDLLVDDLDQFLMDDSKQVKESVSAQEVKAAPAIDKDAEQALEETVAIKEERPYDAKTVEEQSPAVEERMEMPETTPSVGISEERLEETIRNVVEEVVERVARETMASVAEKVITEAIDVLKESLEAS